MAYIIVRDGVVEGGVRAPQADGLLVIGPCCLLLRLKVPYVYWLATCMPSKLVDSSNTCGAVLYSSVVCLLVTSTCNRLLYVTLPLKVSNVVLACYLHANPSLLLTPA